MVKEHSVSHSSGTLACLECLTQVCKGFGTMTSLKKSMRMVLIQDGAPAATG